MGENNDRILKDVHIVPEGRLQGNDITFTLPIPGELDISLGEEVRPGPAPETLTVLKTKTVRFLISCLRSLTQNPTPFKIFAKKGYPASDKAMKSIPCSRQKCPKTTTLTGRTSTFSRYKGVPRGLLHDLIYHIDSSIPSELQNIREI